MQPPLHLLWCFVHRLRSLHGGLSRLLVLVALSGPTRVLPARLPTACSDDCMGTHWRAGSAADSKDLPFYTVGSRIRALAHLPMQSMQSRTGPARFSCSIERPGGHAQAADAGRTSKRARGYTRIIQCSITLARSKRAGVSGQPFSRPIQAKSSPGSPRRTRNEGRCRLGQCTPACRFYPQSELAL